MVKKTPKQFLGPENQHQCHIVIKELKSNKENTIDGINAILGKIITFYHKLYTTQKISSAKIDRYLA